MDTDAGENSLCGAVGCYCSPHAAIGSILPIKTPGEFVHGVEGTVSGFVGVTDIDGSEVQGWEAEIVPGLDQAPFQYAGPCVEAELSVGAYRLVYRKRWLKALRTACTRGLSRRRGIIELYGTLSRTVP